MKRRSQTLSDEGSKRLKSTASQSTGGGGSVRQSQRSKSQSQTVTQPANKVNKRRAVDSSSGADDGEDFVSAREDLPLHCDQSSHGTGVPTTQVTQVLGSGGTVIIDSAKQRGGGTEVLGSVPSNKPLAKKGRKANPGDISQITGKEVKPRNRKKKTRLRSSHLVV